ncbi:MAG: response regulator [Bacteroidia bacterium]
MDLQNFTFNHIMIVDDTKIDRRIAAETIKKNGFAKKIIEFDMATTAIEYLEENQNNPEKLPEIIFLDIRMPVMDGFQFLDRLALLPELNTQISVIILSCSTSLADQQRAESNSLVKKFLNKPLNQSNLEQTMALYSFLKNIDDIDANNYFLLHCL